MSESAPHIFLSHAAVDKDLADKLADLLQTGCNLSAYQIFCTSLEGMGIPAGKVFPEFIREKIQNPVLVIALITPSYLASEFCLCELGATWAMEHAFFPLIVPPAKRENVKGVLTGIQIEKIDDSVGLDNLRDEIKRVLGAELATARWTAKRDAFLNALPALLKNLNNPDHVKREELTAEREKYSAAMEEVAERDSRIRELEGLCEELKACKNAEEVGQVMSKHIPDDQRYERLVEVVRDSFEGLPSAAKEAIYQRQLDRPIEADRWGRVEPHEADSALEQRYIDHISGSKYEPNINHPKMAKAMAALEGLRDFIDTDMSNELYDSLLNKHEFPIELSNRAYWNVLFR